MSYFTVSVKLHLVLSFFEFVLHVLELHGVEYFFSEKLNQEPVEENFRRIRSRDGGSDIPTLEQYGYMNQKVIVAVTKGNTIGRVKENRR